jgi:hypothetical protein
MSAREFHLCADEPALHTAGAALRGQFHQESVLSFGYLPQSAPGVNAILITVPMSTSPASAMRWWPTPRPATECRGGSVTTTDHTLILVAGNDDREDARRLVDAAGGNWNTATIAYGRREFVE